MENLRLARKAKHLTQEDLGKLVNVQKAAISKYEKGYIQPSQEILIKLSEVLDVSTDYLIGNSRSSNDTNPPLTLNEKQLIKKYRLLDTYGQKAVNHMLDIEYERCSRTEEQAENQQVLSYVARSGERGTIAKPEAEVDEIFSKLKPDTSEQY